MPLFLLFLAILTNYHLALPGYQYQFPRDHFDHPDFRTEWWYYTGNVRAADGHRYGFELVFFREGQRDKPNAAAGSSGPAAWRVDDLYLSHLSLTDIDSRRFLYFKRLNRAGPGIAGASFAERRIWNGNWQAKWENDSGAQTLTAVAEGIRFTLHLTPQTPPIIEGENGVSQKADGAGRASYYVSFPRLTVQGTLNGAEVTGTAWMDHEWFTMQLGADQRGWDWFSVQLDDGSELMLFDLRRFDNFIDPHSSGTYIARDGRSTHLIHSDFNLQPLDYWTSSKTHVRYPIHWRITVPSLKLALDCTAAIPDQELLSDDTSPAYWEGAVTYSGSAHGVGYLELTGYGEPVKL